MRTILITLLAICFETCRSSLVVLNASGDSKLVAVVVHYRHGDRAPIESFPNDQYFNSTYWPMGFGQLTREGIMRHYNLGKWLRKHYKHFLNQIYTPDEISIISTDTDRTLMSAYANLAGLYPPQDFQIWNNNILWQPIPVHTTERKKDDIITQERECKKFHKNYEKLKQEKYQKLEIKYAALLQYIKEHSGWTKMTLDQVRIFRSNMYTYSSYNMSFIPKWAASVDQSVLDYLAAVVYQLPTSTTTLARLNIGPFFHYLCQYFDKFIKPSSEGSNPKFLMLSGHDTTLVSIVNAMGAFKMRPVNFADTLIWELRKRDDGTYFVNLLYKRNEDLEELNIRECHFDCDYNDFKKSMSGITITIKDWLKECDSENMLSI